MTWKTEMLASLVQEQGGICAYCETQICSLYGLQRTQRGYFVPPKNTRIGELDHKIPRSRGGSDARENLCACCSSCNGQKRDKTAEEYAAWKAAKRGPRNEPQSH